jgi:hypothetical protein
MRVPISAMKEGFSADWPVIYDSPEEQLLIGLFNDERIDVELDVVGVDGDELIFTVRRADPKPLKMVDSHRADIRPLVMP